MESVLPIEIQAGLDAARKQACIRANRLRIRVEGTYFPVLRVWEDGFALNAENAPVLRGRVALYDGTQLVSQCLIVASEEEDGELRFEFKRMTEATDEQPLDFYRAPDAPVALLVHS